MSITVKRNFNLPKDFAEKLEKTSKALGQALNDARAQIITRTKGGRGSQGAFKGYSEQYLKFKTSKGRNSTVDLTFTGKMLKAIQVRVEKVSTGLLGRIFFASTQEAIKARVHHLGEGKMPERRFFELTEQQLKEITRKIRDALK